MTGDGTFDEPFGVLEERLRTLLPAIYRESYETVRPVSMGSAGLKYAADGSIAWDEMWASFCDLAMAGGPPHRGRLLEPGGAAETDAQRGRYRQVTEEICRGIGLVTGLEAEPSGRPGWIRVDCPRPVMAEWLMRAIVMENISAYSEGSGLYLPAGPEYRFEKEVKNVITAIAKTSHYWTEHTSREEKRSVEDVFATMARDTPLLRPALYAEGGRGGRDEFLYREIAGAIRRSTGLCCAEQVYAVWLGVECVDERAAIWMMRLLAARNVLSRREERTIFLPMNSGDDPGGEAVVRRFSGVFEHAARQGVV